MFPFLPFLTFSDCVYCNNSKKRNIDRIKRNINFGYDEDTPGSSKEYFVVSSHYEPSVYKFEFISTMPKTENIQSQNILNLKQLNEDNFNKKIDNVIKKTNLNDQETNNCLDCKKENNIDVKTKKKDSKLENLCVNTDNEQEINAEKLLQVNNNDLINLKTSLDSSVNKNLLCKTSESNLNDENINLTFCSNTSLSSNEIVSNEISPNFTNLTSSSTPSSPISKPSITVQPTINTPPEVRAARARQKLFQPSQAMMELFNTNIKTYNNDIPKKTSKENNNAINSEPGPDISESNVLSSEETTDLQNDKEIKFFDKKSLKSKNRSRLNNYNSRNNQENNFKTNDLNLLSNKIPLSDPGPELPSETEETEEEQLEENCSLKIQEDFNEKNTSNNFSEKTIIEEIQIEKNTNQNFLKDENKIIVDIANYDVHEILNKENEKNIKTNKNDMCQDKIEHEQPKTETMQKDFRRGKRYDFNRENDNYDIFGKKKSMDIIEKNEHEIKQQTKSQKNLSIETNVHLNNLSLQKEQKRAEFLTSENDTISTILTQQDIELSKTYKIAEKKYKDEFLCKNLDNEFLKTDILKKKSVLNELSNKNFYENGVFHNQNLNSQPTITKNFLNNQNFDKNSLNCGFGSGGSEMVNINETNQFNDDGISGLSGISESVILIKQANVVNDDEIFLADILVEDGIITKISSFLSSIENAKVINAFGQWLLPAGIDVHTNLISKTYFTKNFIKNSTKAALAGGTTTIIDCIDAKPNELLTVAVNRSKQLVETESICNFGFSVILRDEWNVQIQNQMTELVKEKGINNFVLEFKSEAHIFEAFEHAKSLGAFCSIVPEDAELLNLLEKRGKSTFNANLKLNAERIHRFCVLSQLANAPISIFLNKNSYEINKSLKSRQSDGAIVNTEISLSSFSQNENLNASNHYALELLSNNQLAICISKDKIGTNESCKDTDLNLKNDLNNIENRLSILWQKGVIDSAKLDPMRFVATTSTNAAKMFNIYPKKGRIAVGSDADLVLWNFDVTRVLSNNEKVQATPIMTMCGGKIVYCKGNFSDLINKETLDEPSLLLNLKPNSIHLYSIIHLREKSLNFFQFPINFKKNEKLEMNSSFNLKPSRRNSTASSCASNSTANNASVSFERKTSYDIPSVTVKQPITAGVKNRNVQSTDTPKRSTTKVIHPPGGKSTGFW